MAVDALSTLLGLTFLVGHRRAPKRFFSRLRQWTTSGPFSSLPSCARNVTRDSPPLFPLYPRLALLSPIRTAPLLPRLRSFAKQVTVQYLAAAAALCASLWYTERTGNERSVPMVIAGGVALWYCLLKGGINADVAGVVAAMALPTPKQAPAEGTVLDRLHSRLAPVTALLIMPAFALANCAVPLDSAMFAKVFELGAGLGPMLGLLLGKPVGIAGLSYLAVKAGWASWPTGMELKHLAVVGVLGGIGFTMSLFLIQCSFTGAAAPYLNVAKLGVFLGSLGAALAGAGLMMLFPQQQQQLTPAAAKPVE